MFMKDYKIDRDMAHELALSKSISTQRLKQMEKGFSAIEVQKNVSLDQPRVERRQNQVPLQSLKKLGPTSILQLQGKEERELLDEIVDRKVTVATLPIIGPLKDRKGRNSVLMQPQQNPGSKTLMNNLNLKRRGTLVKPGKLQDYNGARIESLATLEEPLFSEHWESSHSDRKNVTIGYSNLDLNNIMFD